MRDPKPDQQMSLPLSAAKGNEQANGSPQVAKAPNNISNLNARRLDLHEQAVLQRVIREGYFKSKT